MASYLLFWKIFGDIIHEKFKNSKKKKSSKNVIIFSSNLNHIFGLENGEIWFSLFLEKL